MVLKAEKFGSKKSIDLKATYNILGQEPNEKSGNTESILRYIPGDPNDSFDIILN